jgi:hypothetical protein
MNELFKNNLKITFDKIENLLVDGNQSRSSLIKLGNVILEEAFNNGFIDSFCKMNQCSGNKNFKNKFSSFIFRSGIEISIFNSNDLSNKDMYIICSLVLSNPYFVRKLLSLGFDTLRLTAKETNINFDVELIKYSNINLINLLK